jgi:phage terminase large subunit GpA-like protein
VPCPHCKALHTLEFDNLSDDGRMLCPNCGDWIGEEHKTWMLAAENGAQWVPKYPDRAGYGHGYDLNALYTPFRLGDNWAELAKQRAKARDNPDKDVAFTQMKMGKPYRGERQRADADTLKERAELGLMVGVVPRGYYILTAGVDCQADRFAIKIMAWGRNERGVVVSYEEIPGDPSHQSGYEALDAHLQREYRKGGVALVPKCIAIDGGNWTEEVATFVRTRQRRMVKCGDGFAEQFMVLVRGRSADSTRVVNRPRKSETNSRGKTIVENNTFVHCKMDAILVGGDADDWFESGPVRDMLIRGNTFIDCGIAIVPNSQSNKPEQPVHENIRIIDNYFDSAGVSAKNSKGLIITGNRSANGVIPIKLESSCSETKIENNERMK